MRSPFSPIPVPLPGGSIDIYAASSIEQLLQTTNLPIGASEPGFHGALLWPGAVLLAQLLAEGPQLEGLTTLELGCGTGLCSLAAAARGASSIATDVSPLSLQLTTHAAAEQGLDVQAGYFDLACTSQPLPAADLVLAADVLYLSELTRSVASRIAEARARGSLVLLTDSRATHRGALLSELAAHGHTAAFEPRRLAAGLSGMCDVGGVSLLRVAPPPAAEQRRLCELHQAWFGPATPQQRVRLGEEDK